MDKIIDNIDFIPRKVYPNRVDKCTQDSETVQKVKEAEVNLKLNGGIAFYCSKRHQYIYIPNTK